MTKHGTTPKYFSSWLAHLIRKKSWLAFINFSLGFKSELPSVLVTSAGVVLYKAGKVQVQPSEQKEKEKKRVRYNLLTKNK